MLHRGADARPRKSYAPSRHARPVDAVLDNLAFATVIGGIANETGAKVRKLRARIAGTAPDCGGAHMCLLSDAYPFARKEGMFLTRVCGDIEPLG